MIVFNSKLLFRLVDILHTSYLAISKNIASASRDTIRRGILRGDIRFDIFIDIANLYRLDLRPFFIEHDKVDMEVKNLVLPKGRFVEYKFETRLLYGYELSPMNIKCKEVADWMNSSHTTMLPVTCRDERVDIGADIVVSGTEGNRVVAEDTDIFDESARYEFNVQFLSSLPRIVGMSRSEIGVSVGKYSNTYTLAVQHEDILVRTLVDICNRFHLPITLFFQQCQSVPSAPIVNEGWVDVKFHPDRLYTLFENRKQKHFLNKIGYTPQRLYRCANPDSSPVYAQELARICNVLSVDPAYFFDSNDTARSKLLSRTLTDKIARQDSTIEQLNKQNKLLESRLRHMQAMQEMGKK